LVRSPAGLDHGDAPDVVPPRRLGLDPVPDHVAQSVQERGRPAARVLLFVATRDPDVPDRAEEAAPGRPPEDVLPVRPERAVLALDPERERVPVREHGAEILDPYPFELDERLGVRAVLVIAPGRVPDAGGDAGRATVEEEAQAVEMVDRDLL